jgi:hypothetical protein
MPLCNLCNIIFPLAVLTLLLLSFKPFARAHTPTNRFRTNRQRRVLGQNPFFLGTFAAAFGNFFHKPQWRGCPAFDFFLGTDRWQSLKKKSTAKKAL